MGCNSDYMNPTAKETQLQETAKLLVWVRQQTGVKPTATEHTAANDRYCRIDFVPELCAAVRMLSPSEFERLVYNARMPISRRLAAWWEEHEAADERRALNEAYTARRQALIAIIKAKLTPEELAIVSIPNA